MNEYPKIKVTLLYSIVGGTIGGMLVIGIYFLVGLVAVFSNNQSYFDIILGFLLWLLLFMAIGICIGFLPALFIGLIISYNRFYKQNLSIYFKIFGIGFLIGMIAGGIFYYLDSGLDDSFVSFCFFIGASFAFASMITGYFVLPKSLNKENGND